jgi:hypothetical protein
MPYSLGSAARRIVPTGGRDPPAPREAQPQPAVPAVRLGAFPQGGAPSQPWHGGTVGAWMTQAQMVVEVPSPGQRAKAVPLGTVCGTVPALGRLPQPAMRQPARPASQASRSAALGSWPRSYVCGKVANSPGCESQVLALPLLAAIKVVATTPQKVAKWQSRSRVPRVYLGQLLCADARHPVMFPWHSPANTGVQRARSECHACHRYHGTGSSRPADREPGPDAMWQP